MKVNVYLTGNNKTHDMVLSAFAEGARESGNTVTERMVYEYEPSDVAVIFGVQKKVIPFTKWRGKILTEQKSRSLQTVVLETGYVRRGDTDESYFAAGLGGINGWADFRAKGMPADRWLRLERGGERWRATRPDGNLVICGQVPWDASVQHIDIHGWVRFAAEQCIRHAPVVYRPHPLAPRTAWTTLNHGITVSRRPLDADLAEARAVVCYNSNAGVDALVAGIPVLSEGEGSMYVHLAEPLSSAFKTHFAEPSMRQQWAYDLAYCQWTPQEMREGLAWRHLFR